jgi:hypothetical protein
MDPQTIAEALVLVRDHRARWHLAVLSRSLRIITAATALPRLPIPFPLHPVLANLRVTVRKAVPPRRRDQTQARLIHLDPIHDLAVLEPLCPGDLADVRPALIADHPSPPATTFRTHVPAVHPRRPRSVTWLNGHTALDTPAQPRLTLLQDFAAPHAQQLRGSPVFTNAGDVIGTVARYPADPDGQCLHAAHLVACLPGWLLFTEHRAITSQAVTVSPPTPPWEPGHESGTSVS